MIGSTIAHYRILEKLGEGGMGVVYKAQDLNLDRIVALKFLPQHLNADRAEQARFLQEARAASALNHPHVCNIHSINEQGGQRFIDMEFVEGHTLRSTIAQGTLKLPDLIRYGIQIGEALHEAHSKGIVHRDIKCENIMVNVRNQIKVMDFGLAKLKGSLKLTRTSSTVGTLAYMAPEQLRGGEADSRSDIFSLGVVLFEMATAKLPFRGEHEAAMMYSIVNEECDFVQKYREDLPPEVDRIIHRALEKDPEDRYQHVDDMTSELRKLLKQSSKAIPPASAVPVFHSPQPAVGRQGELVAARMPSWWKNSPTRRYVALASAVTLIVVVCYLAFVHRGKAIDSLAVLPFVIAGGDPSTEYLSDGMTETIINSFSQIPELRVIPRSTVFRFKGNELDPRDIGARLGVRAVLTGRIVKRDDNLNLQVDLIDVDRASQIYGNQYHHRTSDVLLMEEEVSSDLVEQLGVALTTRDRQKFARRHTKDREAFSFYLQGRYQWSRRAPANLKLGISFFKQAIEKDSTFALAYAGLADSYTILGNYNLLPPAQTYPAAKEAAVKAISLDPDLAEAHASLGFAIMNYDWGWAAAERELKRALEIDPAYATARSWYALLLTVTGRFEEATLIQKQATEMDTLSPVTNTDEGLTLYFAHRYDEAIERFEKALRIDPTFGLANVPLGGAYVQKKNYSMAIEKYEQFTMGLAFVNLRHPIPIAALGHAFALSGRNDDAQSMLELLDEMSATQYVAPYWRAVLSTGLGRKKQALDQLEQAWREHDGSMIYLNVDPVFDGLHGESRFAALLKKMNLGR